MPYCKGEYDLPYCKGEALRARKENSVNNLLEKIYNPDVLSCLANLSNDEVFTPPEVANKMIDLLPKELFENDKTTFLDPCCKSGVFLREIMKRILNVNFPNYEEKIALINEKKMNKEKLTNDDMEYEKALQEKIDYVCHYQLYGISITKLTSLLSRRSLYCSKNANSKYSISRFDTDYGHIMFVDMKHTFKNGKCIYCGASESEYGEEKRGEELESHAYQFIHDDRILEEFNMRFDVIIGNPPYQLNDGGGVGSSAVPLYHKFVTQAIKLNPHFLTMIIPSRWFAGGKGLDEFREYMVNNRHIIEIHDFINASDCFPGVEIKGGVCFFLFDRDKEDDCNIITHQNGTIISQMKRPLLEQNSDVFIRYNEAIEIYRKVKCDKSFSELVETRNPFNVQNNYQDFFDYVKKDGIKIYMMGRKLQYLKKSYKVNRNCEAIKKWKVLVAKATGIGDITSDRLKPFIAEPNSICTETYLMIGPFETKRIAENVISYISTKFFHFMFGLRKITQNTTKDTYKFIPLQDFNKSWSDEELYKKYNLTKDEINYIESMIKPMTNDEEDN